MIDELQLPLFAGMPKQRWCWSCCKWKDEDAFYPYAAPTAQRCRECKHEYSRSFEGRYSNLKVRAKKKQLPYMTFAEYVTKMTNAKCHYNHRHKMPEAGIGLDRIDNSKGYTVENTVPCCDRCNAERAGMDHDLYHEYLRRRYGKEAGYCDRALNVWRHPASAIEPRQESSA